MRYLFFMFALLAYPLFGAASNVVPDGWRFSDRESLYGVGIDTEVFRTAPRSYYLKSVATHLPRTDDADTDGHNSSLISQSISVSEYIGKRVRLSMFLKFEPSDNGRGYAGVWVNVLDGSGDLVMGGWDPVSGLQDWVKREIIFDVPSESSSITFGAQIFGHGQVWFDDVGIEIVPESVETKNLFRQFRQESSQPRNLP